MRRRRRIAAMKPGISTLIAAGRPQEAGIDLRAGSVLATAITKNIVGAAVFALSSTMTSSGTGLIPGIAIVVILGVVSAMSFALLGASSADHLYGGLSTEDLWRETVGHFAGAIGLVISFHACGACVQYTSTMAELLGPTVARMLPRPARIACMGALLLPLCLADDLTGLQHSSLLGLVGVIYSVAFVCFRAIDGSYRPGGRWYGLPTIGGIGAAGMDPDITAAVPLLGAGWGTFGFIGALNTAYFAHLNVPAYWQAWRKLRATSAGGEAASRRGFQTVIFSSFALVGALYVLVLVAGSHTFGASSGSSLTLLRYAADDPGASLMRLATLVSIFGGYPLIFQAVKDVLCARCLPPAAPPAARKGVGLGLLIVLTAAAVGVENVAKFIALRGALFGSLLVYTMPAAIGLAASRKSQTRDPRPLLTLQEGALVALGLYGLVSSAAGTMAVLRS